MAEAALRAGSHLACYPGCAVCCFGPFPITQMDAQRLREGLAAAPAEVRQAILHRAAAARRQLSAAFPGDAATGALAPDLDEAAFAAQFADLACPVLDPDSGRCLLHAWRPIACRLYGLPSIVNGEPHPHCPLCFRRASDAEVKQATAVIALGVEEEPDAPAALEPSVRSVIAYAFPSPTEEESACRP